MRHLYKIKSIDGYTIASWESKGYMDPKDFSMDRTKYRLIYHAIKVLS